MGYVGLFNFNCIVKKQNRVNFLFYVIEYLNLHLYLDFLIFFLVIVNDLFLFIYINDYRFI